jgi:long-chain acyl-CoA synthetase
MNGATMVVLESLNPREVLAVLEKEGITLYPGVPFMFKLLNETRLNRRPDLSRLRLAFSAGAALDPPVSRNFYKGFGLHVRQLYGSTETGSVTINLDPDIEPTIESVGRAMFPAEVAIFDESGDPLPNGETGEVGIRSPAMTNSYDGLPEATATSFRNGFFFPGDIGRMDAAGRLTITGRNTFFINVAGNKVDPAEVERAIAAHPKVSEAVVLGVKAPYGGEMIKAVVVARETCEPGEILEVCKGRLAEYKLPKLIEFRDEIPRSPLGKVLRKYLV